MQQVHKELKSRALSAEDRERLLLRQMERDQKTLERYAAENRALRIKESSLIKTIESLSLSNHDSPSSKKRTCSGCRQS